MWSYPVLLYRWVAISHLGLRAITCMRQRRRVSALIKLEIPPLGTTRELRYRGPVPPLFFSTSSMRAYRRCRKMQRNPKKKRPPKRCVDCAVRALLPCMYHVSVAQAVFSISLFQDRSMHWLNVSAIKRQRELQRLSPLGRYSTDPVHASRPSVAPSPLARASSHSAGEDSDPSSSPERDMTGVRTLLSSFLQPHHTDFCLVCTVVRSPHQPIGCAATMELSRDGRTRDVHRF
jgi:hypothetical protein